MPTVELSQGQIHYRSAGPADSAAAPVVFVHGLLVNGELWTAAAEALAALGIRSYAPDLPLGSHPVALNATAELGPRAAAQLILDFLAALDLHDVTLVGNDTGGALCQFLIDSDHGRIGRLVLTNCDAFDQFPPAPFGLLVAAGRRAGRLRLLMKTMKPRWARHSFLGYGGLVAKPLDAELTARWIAPGCTDRGVARDAAGFMAAIEKRDLLDVSTRLSDFPKPVLLVWGEADRFFRIALAERLQQAFADARLVRVEGGRTFLALDEPQRLAEEIAAFVRTPA